MSSPTPITCATSSLHPCDPDATAQIKQNPPAAGPRRSTGRFCKERRLVECFFNKVKRFRGIASRCEKIIASFRSFVALACAITWQA